MATVKIRALPPIGQEFWRDFFSDSPPNLTLYLTMNSHDGHLFVREGNRICIPDLPDIKADLLQETHDSSYAGHPELGKTYVRLAAIAFWPNMKRSVEKYVRSRHTYSVAKATTTRPHGPLQPLPIPDRPWSHNAMDLITPLPMTKRR